MNELETIELDEPETRSTEGQRILSWRHEQLIVLGFDEAEARLLAEGNADLGLLRRLVASGCTPELAFQIAF